MEFRVGVGEWNCRFFVSKFLTRITRARSASPRSGCPSRGEALLSRAETQSFLWLPAAGESGHPTAAIPPTFHRLSHTIQCPSSPTPPSPTNQQPPTHERIQRTLRCGNDIHKDSAVLGIAYHNSSFKPNKSASAA